MDKLFLYEPDEMIKKIKVIEPEMREDSYGEITEGLDTTSRNALAYIFEIFSYMKKNWNIDQCTVLALMKELYRIASTGEYSYLQDFEKISYEDTVEAIVDLIVKENAGARSVKNIMNQFADNAYFYDMKVGGYSCMKIHKGMLQGEAPIFIKGGRYIENGARHF